MLFYIPFFIQTLIIGVDEFHFHWKRGLPRWERLGHPLDTLTIVIVLVYTLVFPFTAKTLVPYIILATLSAIFVTKDEFVHKECCSAKEQWLHAVLFLNHPLVLISAAFLWSKGATAFLALQAFAAFAFCLYQLIYWNFIWKEQ